jgi:GNAT superfamily N-acetyltransferase
MALWRIRATVDDRPGYLSVLTASLALRSVNILAVQVHTTEAGAVDDFLIDAPDTLTEADLLAAINRGRGRDAFVTRAEAQGLADQPTRALALAGRLVHDPDALGESLVTLLDATEVRWRPDSAPGHGFSGPRMTLADPAGGSYAVIRPAPAFTPAEFARAQALVEVGGAVLRRAAEQIALLLPDGAELLIRPATADDTEAVRRLHARSSATTRRRRYLGGRVPGGQPTTGAPRSLPSAGGPDSQAPGHAAPDTAGPATRIPEADLPSSGEGRLRRLLEPAGGLTLLAVHHDAAGGEDRVVAMANLLAEGDLGEIAVLVEDAWQRRGIGTVLLRRLMAHAERSGFAAVVAHTGADNVGMQRTLRRIGHGTTDHDGNLVSVTLPIAEPTRAADEAPATSG